MCIHISSINIRSMHLKRFPARHPENNPVQRLKSSLSVDNARGAGAKTSVIINNKQFEPILNFWNTEERPGVSLATGSRKHTLNKSSGWHVEFLLDLLITRVQPSAWALAWSGRRTLAVNANSLDIYEHVYVINFYDGSDNGAVGAIRLSQSRCLSCIKVNWHCIALATEVFPKIARWHSGARGCGRDPHLWQHWQSVCAASCKRGLET